MRKLSNRPDAEFLTLKQTADLLNTSVLTCRKICADAGVIRRFGSKIVRVDRKALLDYINAECTDNPAEQG